MSKLIITIILILGVIYRLFLTFHGNFLFNMDNARDFVDIREMIELKKPRLTGPTSAIDGFYNGPLWYYLLAFPYLVTGGDPYGAILMEIILWVIGGIFLLKLVKHFGKFLIIPIGLVWVTSNYIVLTNLYSFNPNPIVLLTTVFIYGLVEYLKGKKYWIILVWFLGGAFFNFEMNFGVFTPLIIFLCILVLNRKLLKDRFFWGGLLLFVLTLLPQILFDLKHQFIMSKSIVKFLSEGKGGQFNILKRTNIIWNSYFSVLSAMLMNQRFLSWGFVFLLIPYVKVLYKSRTNIILWVLALFITIPFISYLFIPVSVNAWHLGGFAGASLILIAYILSTIWKIGFRGKVVTGILSFFLIWYSLLNIVNYFENDFGKTNPDPSLYKNEISAIDYVYKHANGQNFKVYTYLPSVYDYPYQYLFWWYGQKKYGYIPGEYTYAPNKPIYIPSQDKFQGRKDNLSDLVFLIKEPDRIKYRAAWENDYQNMQFVSKETIGSIEVEIRKDLRFKN